ncbi:Glutathione import ATP-binding protein GsiA [compost metagenome]
MQAQVLQLLFSMQAETGAAVLFITHDLGVVAEIADRVVVMQAGRVVEEGAVLQIFRHPSHPYTQALLAAVPNVDAPRDPTRRLGPPRPVIEGAPR